MLTLVLSACHQYEPVSQEAYVKEADPLLKFRRMLLRYKRLTEEELKEIEEKDRVRNFQPPINGEEIMSLFGLEPCGVIGELKVQIKDAILDGVIPNEHDAAYDLLLKLAADRGLKPIS